MASTLAASRGYLPSAESLAHRAHIASTLSSLWRPTIKVPFWELGVHRIPTLWTLYRGLLANAPAEIVRTRIRWEFTRFRHLTSPTTTRDHLRRLGRWMEIFKQAKLGDERLQAILRRYVSMLEARRDKDRFAGMLREEMAWQERMRTRPRLTGTFLRASLYNAPLPMLKPQPINLTGMLVSRHRKRVVRQEHLDNLSELVNDLHRESDFERNLEMESGLKLKKVISESALEMNTHIKTRLRTIERAFALDKRRQMTPRSPELIEMVQAARRYKWENKRRERQREERGEVLPITVRRARKRPPSHILVQMTNEQKRLDAISRSSVSEVGYIGHVKKKLGWKLRNPNAWKVENGRRENAEALDKMDAYIREENERRRQASEASEEGQNESSNGTN